MGTISVFLFLSILFGTEIILTTASATQDRLMQDLHNKSLTHSVRPVRNQNESVVVAVGMALIDIDELDEENEILYTNMWMRYLWHDTFWTWNPADYDSITAIRLKLSSMWTPDITIYNRRKDSEVGDVHGVLYHDGNVLHIPPANLATHCYVDLTYFPFDTQLCQFKVGSWVYDGHAVDLQFYEGMEKIDFSDYHPNKKWTIVGNSARYTEKFYPCCSEPYPDITFNITLKRNPGYYTYVYLGPAVVLALLAPFVFLLPPADPQKLTLGSGILFCFTLFFISLSRSIPGMHADTPLIDKYYMAMYVLLCVALSLATLVSNLAKRANSSPPAIIKTIFVSCLGRILCVPNNAYSDVPSGDESSGEAELMKRQESAEVKSNAGQEWFHVAAVLDRLLFLVYLILTILITVIILNAYPRGDSSVEGYHHHI